MRRNRDVSRYGPRRGLGFSSNDPKTAPHSGQNFKKTVNSTRAITSAGFTEIFIRTSNLALIFLYQNCVCLGKIIILTFCI